MTQELKVIMLKGTEIVPYVEDLAKLQMEVFKSYPYLYETTLKSEVADLSDYVACSESIMVAVFDRNRLVGASTALPLQFAKQRWARPFIENNIPIEEVFYFCGSALLPVYRGKRLYGHFLREREKFAHQYGSKMTAFCAVERPPKDTRKPDKYMPLDEVWRHFGYEQHPELCAYEAWKEIGEETASIKPLLFWIKKL